MIVSYPAMEHKKAFFLRPDKRDFIAEDSNGTTARKGGHSKRIKTALPKKLPSGFEGL